MSFTKKKIIPISIEKQIELSEKEYLSKNTILLQNIPIDIYSKEILYQKKFLGQYGHINKIFLFQKNKEEKKENNAIIQFDTINQAALTITSLHNFNIGNNQRLKISYLITKYCPVFLQNKTCFNYNCFCIHSLKISDYLLKEIYCKEVINSNKFALSILNVTESCFNLIFENLIGDNFYERQKKFPKMTMKKLKSDIFNKLSKEECKTDKNDNLKSNTLFKKQCIKINKNSVKQLKNLRKIIKINNNLRFSNSIYNNKEESRFQFVNKEENINDKVIVPDFVRALINKLLFSNNFLKYNNNDLSYTKYFNFNNYHLNWFDFFFS